jgi:hypothetical protein
MNMLRRPAHVLAIASAVAAATISTAGVAAAQITRIVIDPAKSQSPAFQGRVFGPGGRVGPYEKLRGTAYGEVDPQDPRNAVMTDLHLAPRNAQGRVEYSMDIFILKPIDLARGSQKAILDVNNRGDADRRVERRPVEQQPDDRGARGRRVHHGPRVRGRWERMGFRSGE